MTNHANKIAVFAMLNIGLADSAMAQQLGGGDSPDISFWRILLSLVMCLLIAVVVIWFLYARNMKQSRPGQTPSWLNGLPFLKEEGQTREIDIVEMRKLNPTTDICLLKCREREYLVLLGSDGVTILQEYDHSNPKLDME